MPNFKAKRNLTIGDGPAAQHKDVKAGEVFECSQEYHDEHLAEHEHAEPTTEPVTAKAKAAAKKAAKAGKAEEPADDKGGKGKGGK